MNSFNDDDSRAADDDFGSQDPDLNDLKGIKKDDLDIDDLETLPKEEGEEEDDGLDELRAAEKELEEDEEDSAIWDGVDLGDELNDNDSE